MRAHNLLSTGMGGWDWAGLPIVCAMLGIDDPEALIDQLLTIKTHRPTTAGDNDARA